MATALASPRFQQEPGHAVQRKRQRSMGDIERSGGQPVQSMTTTNSPPTVFPLAAPVVMETLLQQASIASLLEVRCHCPHEIPQGAAVCAACEP